MSKRILVIEDEAQFRAILQEVLAQAGHEVIITPYIASAIAEALSGEFDLITLDLKMPGMDGVEIAQLLNRQNVTTPVLIISGYLDKSVKKKLKDTGICHFLDKPSGVCQLIHAVEEAMD